MSASLAPKLFWGLQQRARSQGKRVEGLFREGILIFWTLDSLSHGDLVTWHDGIVVTWNHGYAILG